MEDWALIRRLVADGVPKARIAERLGISRTTVVKAAGSDAPPRYERRPAVTSFASYEGRVRELLKGTPDMPATVLAERVGWDGSISWFREHVKRLRPEVRVPDPADRLVWEPGDAAQCDLWFPPKRIPLEDGSRVLLPVLVITAAYSRFTLGRMLPSRKTTDLLLGSWELLRQLGRVPRRLIWDNEAGIGRGHRPAEGVTAFTGPGDEAGAAPAAGSGIEGHRRATQRVLRVLVHAGPVVHIARGLQHPVHGLAGSREPQGGSHDEGAPERPARA